MDTAVALATGAADETETLRTAEEAAGEDPELPQVPNTLWQLAPQ